MLDRKQSLPIHRLAANVADRLNLHAAVQWCTQASEVDGTHKKAQMIYDTDGIAQVFPEHKFEIVKQLQSLDKVVGMTGDGVNDASALAQADIGIAVDDATDAARAAADIVLVSPGLSEIITLR